MVQKRFLVAVLFVQTAELVTANAANLSTTATKPCAGLSCNQTCIPGRESSYTCGCRKGFRLLDDKASCVADNWENNFILVLSKASHKILQVSLNDSRNFSVLPLGNDVTPTSLAYDHVDRHIFYWDAVTKCVWRSRLNGTEKTVFLASVHALYMAVDTLSRNLYIVDGRRESILVASLQLPNITKTLPVNDVFDKMSLHTDANIGKIFWCESGTLKREGLIESANLDGTARKIHVHDRFQPIDITVDTQLMILYWIDKLNDSIGWFDLKSGEKGRFSGPIKGATLGSIAIQNSTMYISTVKSSTNPSNKTSAMFAVRVDGLRQNGLASYSKLLDIPYEGRNLLYVHPQHKSTPKTSACAENRGGCHQICLPETDRSGKKCVCGDNHKFVAVNSTCIQDIDNVPSFGRTCSNTLRIHYVNQCKGTAFFNFTEPTARDVTGPVKVTSLSGNHPPYNLSSGVHSFPYQAVGLTGRTAFCYIQVTVKESLCQTENFDRRFGATPTGNFSKSIDTTRCPTNTSGAFKFFRSRYGSLVRTLLVECHPVKPSNKTHKDSDDPQNAGSSASVSGGIVVLIIFVLLIVLCSATFILHRFRRGNSRLQYYLWRKDYDAVHLTADPEDAHHYA